MKKKTTLLLIVTLILTVIAGCNKNQFTTKPQLKFIGTSSDVFVVGQLIEFNIEYTDKEGDIQNNLYIEEVTKDALCPDNNFKSLYTISPDVPKQNQSKGNILVRYIYGQTGGQYPDYPGPKCGRNDTCVFRFALTDKANNTSDTITSPQIVFIK